MREKIKLIELGGKKKEENKNLSGNKINDIYNEVVIPGNKVEKTESDETDKNVFYQISSTNMKDEEEVVKEVVGISVQSDDIIDENEKQKRKEERKAILSLEKIKKKKEEENNDNSNSYEKLFFVQKKNKEKGENENSDENDSDDSDDSNSTKCYSHLSEKRETNKIDRLNRWEEEKEKLRKKMLKPEDYSSVKIFSENFYKENKIVIEEHESSKTNLINDLDVEMVLTTDSENCVENGNNSVKFNSYNNRIYDNNNMKDGIIKNNMSNNSHIINNNSTSINNITNTEINREIPIDQIHENDAITETENNENDDENSIKTVKKDKKNVTVFVLDSELCSVISIIDDIAPNSVDTAEEQILQKQWKKQQKIQNKVRNIDPPKSDTKLETNIELKSEAKSDLKNELKNDTIIATKNESKIIDKKSEGKFEFSTEGKSNENGNLKSEKMKTNEIEQKIKEIDRKIGIDVI